MTTLKMTPDEGLATPEAVRHRIATLSTQAPSPGIRRRLEALRARLPGQPFAQLKPAFNAGLLATKADVDEYRKPYW